MARNAIVDFVNPFFVVLSKDIGRGMLVTTIASIGAIIIIQVAGAAFSIVVLIKQKIGGMVKGGRNPLFGAVAFDAIVF